MKRDPFVPLTSFDGRAKAVFDKRIPGERRFPEREKCKDELPNKGLDSIQNQMRFVLSI